MLGFPWPGAMSQMPGEGLAMNTLRDRIKSYLRDEEHGTEEDIAEAEYEQAMREKAKADLERAQEHLEKLKRYR